MVINYQQLNNTIKDDTNKALYQEQKRDLLQEAKIITVFNVKWEYYNLQIKPEDIQKTTFLTDLRLYKWVVAPIELKQLPAKFARYMTHVL